MSRMAFDMIERSRPRRSAGRSLRFVVRILLLAAIVFFVTLIVLI
jgi:hypothetical protein